METSTPRNRYTWLKTLESDDIVAEIVENLHHTLYLCMYVLRSSLVVNRKIDLIMPMLSQLRLYLV